MKEYFFYTAEGTTYCPNGEDVENCQVLGRGFGNDVTEAREDLLKRNPWIIEKGFDPFEMMHVVLDDKLITKSESVIKSLIRDNGKINLFNKYIPHLIIDKNNDFFVDEVNIDSENNIIVTFANAYGCSYDLPLSNCPVDVIEKILKSLK